mmetsp:Transcript_26995/g.23833  ORF Transcript_26995/g.23833 Transcript_26995/m.23833 type:complete len:141 (+) Transcript_26995:848-1270(+)
MVTTPFNSMIRFALAINFITMTNLPSHISIIIFTVLVSEEYAKNFLTHSKTNVLFRFHLYTTSLILMNICSIQAADNKFLYILIYIVYNLRQGLVFLMEIYAIVKNLNEVFTMTQVINLVRGGDFAETLYLILDHRSRNN